MKSNIVALASANTSYAVMHDSNIMCIYNNKEEAEEQLEYLDYEEGVGVYIEEFQTNEKTSAKRGIRIIRNITTNKMELEGDELHLKWEQIIHYGYEIAQYPYFPNNSHIYEHIMLFNKVWTYNSVVIDENLNNPRTVTVINSGPLEDVRHVLQESLDISGRIKNVFENIPDRVCETCKKKNKYQKYHKKRKPSYYTWGVVQRDGNRTEREYNDQTPTLEHLQGLSWVCSPKCGVKAHFNNIEESPLIRIRFGVNTSQNTFYRELTNENNKRKIVIPNEPNLGGDSFDTPDDRTLIGSYDQDGSYTPDPNSLLEVTANAISGILRDL